MCYVLAAVIQARAVDDSAAPFRREDDVPQRREPRPAPRKVVFIVYLRSGDNFTSLGAHALFSEVLVHVVAALAQAIPRTELVVLEQRIMRAEPFLRKGALGKFTIAGLVREALPQGAGLRL